MLRQDVTRPGVFCVFRATVQRAGRGEQSALLDDRPPRPDHVPRRPPQSGPTRRLLRLLRRPERRHQTPTAGQTRAVLLLPEGRSSLY